jgi:hypothetical protein
MLPPEGGAYCVLRSLEGNSVLRRTVRFVFHTTPIPCGKGKELGNKKIYTLLDENY